SRHCCADVPPCFLRGRSPDLSAGRCESTRRHRLDGGPLGSSERGGPGWPGDRAEGSSPPLWLFSYRCVLFRSRRADIGGCITLPRRCVVKGAKHLAAVRLRWHWSENRGQWARETLLQRPADRL